MSKMTISIIATTSCVLLYVILASLPTAFPLVFLLLLLSQCLLVWMVIRILKDNRPSTRTFDEYFYEDADIRRNTGVPK